MCDKKCNQKCPSNNNQHELGDIFHEAKGIINGDRDVEYGNQLSNFFTNPVISCSSL